MAGSIPDEALARSIPERFAEVVERHPERPAVRYDGGEISYRALLDRARGVAALIREHAGDPPGAVAILVPQGIAQIVAILGVLQSGDWYVPLDLSLDTAHLHELIVRAEAKLVLATKPTHARAEAAARGVCAVGCVDGMLPPGRRAESSAGPESLAYVYFTSGTTGAPKGVMDTHRNVIHNVQRYGRALGWTHMDQLTLVQAAHFSGAVSNVFGALLHGALLLPYDVERDGAGPPLARWLERERPTAFHSVPSLFRSVCLDGEEYPSIRTVRLEGDGAAPGDIERFNRHFTRGAQLVHGLGTTETGIAAQWFVRHGDPVPGSTVPVGRATAGMTLQVVDEGGVPVRAGEVGEIVVRSRHLAAGYCKDPERTAHAFSFDPADPVDRWYRTGDVGRMSADGVLEHLGRRDRQLKVRGQWVDGSAVESALACLPSVAEAAVTLERAGDENLLAAYLVIAGAPAPDAVAMRRQLAEQLPAHAVPVRLYAIDRLPLGPHGKLDRGALSPARGRALADAAGDAPPRTEREHALVTIWKEVLRLERLGIHDRFIERGGDSLTAVTVALEIERRLGVTVPHAILAEAPTVAELAARLDGGKGLSERRARVPIQTAGSRPPLFCIHDLESEAFLFAPLARRLGPDQPVYALRPPVGDLVRRMPRSIQSLAAIYMSEIHRIAPAGPYAIAGFCFGAVVALEVARQLREWDLETGLLALINVTAYDFPTLVSARARARFRSGWGARARYLMRKPNPLTWTARRLAGTAERVAGTALLPMRLARLASDAPTTPSLVRASLFDAFRRHQPTPHAGAIELFVADENLPLYTDDPHEAWQGIATGPIAIHRLPRDGYAMLSEPDVARVAEILTARLRS